MDYKITSINVFPIKSFQGIAMDTVALTTRGIEYDRRWMLVDDQGNFITQREIPKLVLFELKMQKTGIHVSHPASKVASFIPFDDSTYTDEIVFTKVWGQECKGQIVSKALNNWLSNILDRPVKLIYHPEDGKRTVKDHPNSLVGFPDSSQYLMIGESALHQLNEKLKIPIPMNRFRPNFVFSGGTPHIEDLWSNLKIGEIHFEVVKSCGRCQMTTFDQETGEMLQEPMKTLSTYRRLDKKILFGRYLKLQSELPATLNVGDLITTVP